jgi:hypothetical protein
MPGTDQVDDRTLGARHELELAVEAARRSWISNSSSSKRLDVVELELFSVRAESRSRKARSASGEKDLRCFHALTSLTAQKAFVTVGSAFVTADGAL